MQSTTEKIVRRKIYVIIFKLIPLILKKIMEKSQREKGL
jgi:hypothetical protein